MKTKKMFSLFAAFIFAAVAIYNIHLAQSNQNSDVSLADITVMAQADGESGGGSCLGDTYILSKVVRTSFFLCVPSGTFVMGQTCELFGDGCTEIKEP